MYFWLFLGTLLIPLSAQLYVRASYNKFSKIKNNNKISGFEVARKILDKNELEDVHIVQTSGILSDHYDPKRKAIRLSKDIFNGESIASISVAAHEACHTIQDKENYAFIKIRTFIYPIVNFTSKIAYILLIVGFITSIVNLIWLGIILISSGIIFQFITLPVEFNASKKARKELESLSIFDSSEINDVESMLRAAALTYVAGLLSSVLELLRLILIARDN